VGSKVRYRDHAESMILTVNEAQMELERDLAQLSKGSICPEYLHLGLKSSVR